MKVDFTRFPIYDGIKKEKLIANDITEDYSDWIYKNVPGIKAHVLSEKILKSDSEGVELDDAEVNILRSTCTMLPGALADSINDYLDKKGKEAKDEN